MAAEESLVINIKINNADKVKDLDTELDNIKSHLKEISTLSGGKGLSGINKALKGIKQASEESYPATAKVKNVLKQLDITSTETEAGIKKVQSALKNLSAINKEKVEPEALKEMEKVVDELQAKVDTFNATLKKQKEKGGDLTNGENTDDRQKTTIEQISDLVEEMKKKLKDSGGMWNVFTTAVYKTCPALKSVRTALDMVANSCKGLFIAIAAITAAVKVFVEWVKLNIKVYTTMAKVYANTLKVSASLMALPFKKVISGVKEFTSKFENLFKRIKKMAFTKIIRSIISSIQSGLSEGIENLYYYSTIVGTKFADSMNTLATSMLYLKNSIAAMGAPLVNAIVPYIDAIVDRIVEFINILNQAFATLTGKSTWTKAIKYPAQYADALDDVGGSADNTREKLNLLAIDELHILKETSDWGGSGGSGDDGEAYALMFEEQKVTTNLSTQAIDLINQSLADIDTYITDTLAPKMETVATAISDTLNEAIGGINWALLGETIGAGVNAIYNATNKFWFNTNWQGLGESIGKTLNSLFDRVDWDTIGANIGNKWNALIKSIYGFVTETKWEDIGKDIGSAIAKWFNTIEWDTLGKDIGEGFNAVVDTVKGLMSKFDIASIGTDFGITVKNWFNTVSWEDVIKTVINGFDSVITALYNFVTTVNLTEVGTKLGTALNNAVADINWEDIGNKIGTFFTECVNGIFAFLDTVEWDEIGMAVGDMLKGINWVEMLSGLGAKIISAIWETTKTEAKAQSKANNRYGGGNWLLSLFGVETDTVEIDITGNLTEVDSRDLPFEQRKIDSTANITKATDSIKSSQKSISGWSALMQTFKDNINKVKDLGGFNAKVTNATDSISANKKTTSNWKANLISAVDAIKSKVLDKYTAKLTNTNNALTASQKTIPTTAKYATVTNALTTAQKTIGTVSKFTQREIALTDGQKTIGTTAKFTARNIEKLNTTITTTANFKNRKFDNAWNSVATLTANFKYRKFDSAWNSNATMNAVFKGRSFANSWDNYIYNMIAQVKEIKVKSGVVMNVTANVEKITGNNHYVANALGGAYYGGNWHSIPQYASGTLNAGSVFIAGEAGAELVGHVNNRTEVLNKSQLASVMYSAVTNGMAGVANKLGTEIINKMVECANANITAMRNNDMYISDSIQSIDTGTYRNYDNSELLQSIREGLSDMNNDEVLLLREQNNLLGQILNKTGISYSELGKASIKYINGETKRTGNSPLVVGG